MSEKNNLYPYIILRKAMLISFKLTALFERRKFLIMMFTIFITNNAKCKNASLSFF